MGDKATSLHQPITRSPAGGREVRNGWEVEFSSCELPLQTVNNITSYKILKTKGL